MKKHNGPAKVSIRFTVELVRFDRGRLRKVMKRSRGPYSQDEFATALMSFQDTLGGMLLAYSRESGQ